MIEGLTRWYWLSYRRRLLNRDLSQFQPHFPTRVLEIGAGRGPGPRRSLQIAPRSERLWVTVDVDPSRCPHVCANAESLPFPSSHFELVICLEVIEYLEHPGRVLNQIHDVLAPSGRLLISSPFVHRWDAPGDRWRLSPLALTELLAEAGFTVETVLQQGSAVAAAANIVKFIWLEIASRFRKLRPLVGTIGLLLLEPIFRLDRPMAALLPELNRFSTGYLLAARRDPSSSTAPV